MSQFHVLEMDPKIPEKSSWFSVFIRIGEQNAQMYFRWETFKEYYYVDIIREDDKTWRFHPRLGLNEPMYNFNDTDPDFSDVVMIPMSVVEGDTSAITPKTLGKSHTLAFVTGVFEP